MQADGFLHDLKQFGEKYNKMSTTEQGQYIIDLCNDILDSDDIEYILRKAIGLIKTDRIVAQCCPLCGTPLKTKTIPSDTLEAWGMPIQTQEIHVKYCENCDWQI